MNGKNYQNYSYFNNNNNNIKSYNNQSNWISGQISKNNNIQNYRISGQISKNNNVQKNNVKLKNYHDNPYKITYNDKIIREIKGKKKIIHSNKGFPNNQVNKYRNPSNIAKNVVIKKEEEINKLKTFKPLAQPHDDKKKKNYY